MAERDAIGADRDGQRSPGRRAPVAADLEDVGRIDPERDIDRHGLGVLGVVGDRPAVRGARLRRFASG